MRIQTKMRITQIRDTANNGPNDPYTALILIRELCDALLRDDEEEEKERERTKKR